MGKALYKTVSQLISLFQVTLVFDFHTLHHKESIYSGGHCNVCVGISTWLQCLHTSSSQRVSQNLCCNHCSCGWIHHIEGCLQAQQDWHILDRDQKHWCDWNTEIPNVLKFNQPIVPLNAVQNEWVKDGETGSSGTCGAANDHCDDLVSSCSHSVTQLYNCNLVSWVWYVCVQHVLVWAVG